MRTLHLIPHALSFPGSHSWVTCVGTVLPRTSPWCLEPVPDSNPMCQRPQLSVCLPSWSSGKYLLRPRRSRRWLLDSSPLSPQHSLQVSLTACQQSGVPLRLHRTETRTELSLSLRRMSLPTSAHLPTSPPRGHSGSRTSRQTWDLVLRSDWLCLLVPCSLSTRKAWVGGLGGLGALFYYCHLGLDPCPIVHGFSDLWMSPAHIPDLED